MSIKLAIPRHPPGLRGKPRVLGPIPCHQKRQGQDRIYAFRVKI